VTTTCRDIITDALERLGVQDLNRAAKASQAAQALRVLQGILLDLPGSRWWIDVEITANYTAGENERIRVNTDSAVTISVPESVSSAVRQLWNCNQIELICTGYSDRAPKNGARVHISDVYSDSQATFYYRSDIAQWTRVDGLTLDSEMPLGDDCLTDISAMLATHLAPYYGTQISPITAGLALRAETKFRARFGKRQEQATDLTLTRLSSNRQWQTI